MINKNLIYDIGANNGNDTAFYLKKGFNVISVEANPALSKNLKSRFSHEMEDGRLIVLNVAISEHDNSGVVFYISRDHEKSSLIKEMSERDGPVVDSIIVTGRTLGSLFDEFGAPYYCKIDIEGYDDKAIRQLTGYPNCPTFISCEGFGKSIEEVNRNENLLFSSLNSLKSAGYSSFKLVDQESLNVLTNKNHYGFLHKYYTRLVTKLERLTGRYSPKYNNKLYEIKRGMMEGMEVSGYFGEDLPEKWEDYESTKRYITYHFRDYFFHTQDKQLTFGIDIHATY
ncbi:FkbM family methyltransferase [Flavitalea flava]